MTLHGDGLAKSEPRTTINEQRSEEAKSSKLRAKSQKLKAES
jgi:hypothetical protein